MYHLFRTLEHKNGHLVWQIFEGSIYILKKKSQTNIQFSLIQNEHCMVH